MGLKLKQTVVSDRYTAKVYYDNDWQEYQVKFYRGLKSFMGEDASYFTNDLEDAINTAKTQLRYLEQNHGMVCYA